MNKRRKTTILTVLLGLFLMALLTGCDDPSRENQEAYKTIGINAMEEKNYEEAVDAFQKALDQSLGFVGAREIDICYYKAIAQYAGGDPAGARETYDALIDYDDSLSEAYFLRGNLSLDQGDDAGAITDYEAAVKRDPENLELYISICENLTNTGHQEDGTAFLKKATELKGSGDKARALKGRAYTLLGDYENAEKELDAAIKAGNSQAELYKGQLLTTMGDKEGATALFQSYLEKNGEDAGALNALGCSAMEIGDYGSALSYFDQALACAEESGVDPKEIKRNRIVALEYTGDFAAAKSAMEEYTNNYELDPDFQKEAVFLQTR